MGTDYRSLHDAVAGEGPEWLRSVRRNAFRRFEHDGFPTTGLEEWKNTDIRSIRSTEYEVSGDRFERWDGDRLDRYPVAASAGARIVFVNGCHAPHLSVEAGARPGIASFSETLEHDGAVARDGLARQAGSDRHPFTALNTGLFEDGALMVVPAGTDLGEPIHVIHVADPGARPTICHPRVLLSAGAGARVSVVESYVGADGPEARHLTNAVTEIVAAEGAEVEHWRVQLEGSGAHHVGRVAVRQERDSRVTTASVVLGAALTRVDAGVVLGGEGSHADLLGLYLADGGRHVDHHTVVDHARPHCTSRELYKGILAGSSRAVFRGRIVVRKDSQKTDAKQSNPNLLLSDDATVHTRPQLEIHADDVRCTHGATIGRLDGDAVFYLRSRGIAENEARNMLVHAFAGEVLEQVGDRGLRSVLEERIRSALGSMEG